MKSLLILLVAVSLNLNSNAQKKEKYYYWTQVKTSDCRSHGISPTLKAGNRIISISFAYVWTKEQCNEATYKNAIQVPKLKKGYILGPGNKHYYNDGNLVCEVKGNSCGTKTWAPEDFWATMQRK